MLSLQCLHADPIFFDMWSQIVMGAVFGIGVWGVTTQLANPKLDSNGTIRIVKKHRLQSKMQLIILYGAIGRDWFTNLLIKISKLINNMEAYETII